MKSDTQERVDYRAWLDLARLQFYPLTLIIFGAGAMLATRQMETALIWPALNMAALCALLAEFITVLTNEISDQESDRINRHAGPFNGGSRVIVSGRLSEVEARRARAGAATLLVLAALTLWPMLEPASRGPILVTAMLGMSLGLGYSISPVRLVSRGLGEVAAAAAHGFVAFFAGILCQGGSIGEMVVWLAAFPIFASILPSILLSGIPDTEADDAVGKRTLAVRLGARAVAWQALIASIAAWAFGGAAVFIAFMQIGTGILNNAVMSG